LFLGINTYNLLPIYPLDGGQLLGTIFRLNRKQLLFLILVLLFVTTLAMVMFRLFILFILIAVQVYWFIILRSEKDFKNDDFYDLNKTKVVLAFLVYVCSLGLALASVAFSF